MSRLDEFECGLTEFMEELGETVEVRLSTNRVKTVTGLVTLDSIVASRSESPIPTTGQVRVSEQDYKALKAHGEVLGVTYKSQDWNVVDDRNGKGRGGLVTLQIRLHDKHISHSNIFDMNDEQARWT